MKKPIKNLKKYLILMPIVLMSSCSFNNIKENTPEQKEPEPHQKTFSFVAHDSGDFKVLNFTDIQVDTVEGFNTNVTIKGTIEKVINDVKPDIITFSGDNAWGPRTLDVYKEMCKYMDGFKIPYFMVFGNHDREYVSAAKIAKVVEASEYGSFPKGEDQNTYGNYTIDIKKNDSIIHSVVMMDSRAGNPPIHSDKIQYVENPVEGVPYNTYNSKEIYGSTSYDGPRDNQIKWYEDKMKEKNATESSLIMHMPMLQYCKAVEQYVDAKNKNDTAKLAELEPIGHNKVGETCDSAPEDYGLFELMKTYNTKNVIAGHDHINDYSLKYEGIRLTFAVKTGSECYWDQTGDTCGATLLKIDQTGKGSIEQLYHNPLK